MENQDLVDGTTLLDGHGLFKDDSSVNYESLESERGLKLVANEPEEKIKGALYYLTWGDFNFHDHRQFLQQQFKCWFVFILWLFHKALGKEMTLPRNYVKACWVYILNKPDDVDLQLEILDDKTTVVSELKRILSLYRGQLQETLDKENMEKLEAFEANRLWRLVGSGPSRGTKRLRGEEDQEVPTGAPEKPVEPKKDKRPGDLGYSALIVALRIMKVAGLLIKDLVDDGKNRLVQLLKALESKQPGAKKDLYDLIQQDHPAGYIKFFLNHLPSLKQNFTIEWVCPCGAQNGEPSVLLEGNRPSGHYTLESALNDAGKKRIFCKTCPDKSQTTAHLSDQTKYLLLWLPVFDGAGALQNCSVGQGTPDFKIRIPFANHTSWWNLRALALHEIGSSYHLFTCVVPTPKPVYFSGDEEQDIPKDLPVAKMSTLWLLKKDEGEAEAEGSRPH